MELKSLTPIQPKNKIKVLWYSNTLNLPTGYAKVTREVCKRLAMDPKYEVHIIGENTFGEQEVKWENCIAHPMCRSDPNKRESFVNSVNHWINVIRPDVSIFLEDTFTLEHMGMLNIDSSKTKVLLYVPLDGEWIPTNGVHMCRKGDKLVSMSKFTKEVLENEGFKSDVIYHGVDLQLFTPISESKKKELRLKYGLNPDSFLIFNYGRNNNARKANQRLLEVLCKYLKDKDPTTHQAYLHLMEYNNPISSIPDFLTRHMVKKFKTNFLGNKILLSPKGADLMKSASDQEVAEYVQMSDIVVTASTGEGFGLLMTEALACGKPVISTDYTTPKELLKDPFGSPPERKDRGILIPIDTTMVAGYNTEHAFANMDSFVKAIETLEKNKKLREEYGRNGREFVELECNWDTIAQQWKKVIDDTI